MVHAVIRYHNSHAILVYFTKLFLYFINSIEYAIAFLGSAEGGLVVTTVNPSYTSEEISRQMLSCQPKVIICLTDQVDVVKKACTIAQQTDIKVITIQNDPNSFRPNDTISFNELINTDGEQK